MNNILALNGNILNPFNPLYQGDTELSSLPELLEIDEYARGLEEQIEGDFDLDYLRFEIFNNRYGFVKNGLILAKIKFLKLYKSIEGCTFESFCKDYLHRQRWQINDTIKAARVFMELMYAGFEVLPANIAQGAALKSLTGDELIHAWREIIEKYDPDQITAKVIRNHLFPPTERDKAIASIKVPAQLHEEIHQTAADEGLSIPKLIKTLLDMFLSRGEFSHLLSDKSNNNNYAQNEIDEEEDLRKFGEVLPY